MNLYILCIWKGHLKLLPIFTFLTLLWNFQQRPYYYRYALEPETNENSLREGKRLEAEAENLKPHILESGKEISYTCLPTMVDGKGTIYILRQQKDWVNGSWK